MSISSNLWQYFHKIGAEVLKETFAIRITSEEEIRRDTWVETISLHLSKLAGGATINYNAGVWQSNSGLEAEPSIMVEVNCSDAETIFWETVRLIWDYLYDCDQEAVWFRINEYVVITTREQFEEIYLLPVTEGTII